ncbi:MAG TPA: DUF1580 domain-containing protein [Schlesneria sp.]|jgi:hypothetical protein
MPIDIKTESLLLFTAEVAGTQFPGEPVSKSTLRRWKEFGVRGAKIETTLIGSRRYTSKEAILRFVEAQQPDPEPPVRIETAPARRRRLNAVNHELRKLGMK